jgi:hypothetical protein
MSNEATVFDFGGSSIRVTNLQAIAELDDCGQAIAAEVLGLKEQIGALDAEMLLTALRTIQARHSYDEQLDILVFSFGSAPRSFGQTPCQVVLSLSGERVERTIVRTN